MCDPTEVCVFNDDNDDILSLGLCVDPEAGICQCSVFLGFKGENCTEVSTQVIIHRVIEYLAFFLYIGLLFLAFYAVREAFFIQIAQTNRQRQKLNETKRHLLYVLILLFISVFMVIIATILFLRALYDPSRIEEVAVEDDDFFVFLEPAQLYFSMLILSAVTQVLSIVAICISWIDLLEQLSDFSAKITYMKTILRVKLVLKYTLGICCFIIAFTTIFFPDEPDIVANTLGAILFFLLVLLFVGRRYLIICLNDFPSSEKTNQTITMITKFALRLALVIILAIAPIIALLIDQSREKTATNDAVDGNVIWIKLISHALTMYGDYVIIDYCIVLSRNLRGNVRYTDTDPTSSVIKNNETSVSRE